VGTFQARKEEVYDAVQFALQAGYKHIGMIAQIIGK
jgi:diketogulonate reductase-like aldo/keto reductase